MSRTRGHNRPSPRFVIVYQAGEAKEVGHVLTLDSRSNGGGWVGVDIRWFEDLPSGDQLWTLEDGMAQYRLVIHISCFKVSAG